MKKFITNLLAAVMLCLSVASCGWLRNICKNDVEPTYGTSMMNSYVMEATRWQIDSICAADALPTMDKWIVKSFRDNETGVSIYKYMYIKSLGKDEVIYIIVGNSEPYSLQRRITK